MTDLPTYSFSRISMFQKCPRQYYYRYERRLSVPPAAAMSLGSAVDYSASFGFRAKMDCGRDEPASVLTDVFVEDFRARKDETDWGDEKPGLVENDGVALVKAYRRNDMPGIEPLAVQERLLVEVPERWRFLGIPDLLAVWDEAAESSIILDIKVSKQAWNQGAADVSDQLSAYAGLVFSKMADGGPQRVGIENLVRGAEPRTVPLLSARTRADAARWWATVEVFHRSVIAMREAGCWIPAPRAIGKQANWVCSPDWCGWWERCQIELNEEAK